MSLRVDSYWISILFYPITLGCLPILDRKAKKKEKGSRVTSPEVYPFNLSSLFQAKSETFDCYIKVGLQFNSHKSVQKLFHTLHTIFSNSLMGFKVICQLKKEPLKELANVQEYSLRIFRW